jgi:HlyD family secretion protein
MKKAIIILIIISLVAIVFVAFGLILVEGQASLISSYETELIERGTLTTVVEANGIVQSNQSALLFWKVSGEVGSVLVKTGDRVSEGDILATLETESLPAYIVAAKAEQISAQRQLDNLLISDSQRAQALKAIDEAEKALEDALHPETIQAETLSNLALAQDALEAAQRNYEIITKPTPQSAIDAAYSNLLLAEDKIAQTEEALEKAKARDIRAVANSDVLPPEVVADLRSDIKELTKQLEFVLAQDKLAYEQSLARYNALISPPDPLDIAVAETELSFAIANLKDAQREWERVKDGFSAAEIAVLEAELGDAVRAYERIKNGPHPDDIAALEAQIAASQAAIAQQNIVAPFDGIITRVHTKDHDIVNLGSLAFQLDDLSHLTVNLSISEVDVNRIKIGDTVTLSFEAVPAQEYLGTIIKVASVGTRFLGATNFRVTAEILDPDERIKPGMTASAQIVIDEVENVMTVPGKAIRGLDGQLVVYKLVENGTYRLPSFGRVKEASSEGGAAFEFRKSIRYEIQPVTITLGITSNNYSEVLTGDLKSGDIIILNPPK